MFDFSSVKDITGQTFTNTDNQAEAPVVTPLTALHIGGAGVDRAQPVQAAPEKPAADTQARAAVTDDFLAGWANEDDFVFMDRSARASVKSAERDSAAMRFSF